MDFLESNKTQCWYIGVFVLILVTELFYRDALFDYSLEKIKELQADRKEALTTVL